MLKSLKISSHQLKETKQKFQDSSISRKKISVDSKFSQKAGYHTEKQNRHHNSKQLNCSHRFHNYFRLTHRHNRCNGRISDLRCNKLYHHRNGVRFRRKLVHTLIRLRPRDNLWIHHIFGSHCSSFHHRTQIGHRDTVLNFDVIFNIKKVLGEVLRIQRSFETQLLNSQNFISLV